MNTTHTMAAFNSAAAFCEELSNIRRQLIDARINHNMRRRYDLLVGYYISLCSRMGESELKSNKLKKIKKHNDYYYYLVYKNMCEYEYAIRTKKLTISNKIFSNFNEWEKLLRQTENELGLLMRDQESAYDALRGDYG